MRPLWMALALAPVLALGAPQPAGARNAWKGPCLDSRGGPTCHFWRARIAKKRGGTPIAGIADGDTIRVRIAGKGRAPRSVRIVGINAMELSRYSNIPSRRRGACHAIAATSLVERWINRAHRVVRLGAQHPSSRTGKRLYRSVAVKVGGHWRDIARLELRAGLALWLANGREYAHNAEYSRLAEQAAGAQRGLYDPDSCGAGPSPQAQLQVLVNWDADGNDEQNLNGEWVRVRNVGGAGVPLDGWWVRDSFLRFGAGHVPGYRFPAGAVVPAGGSVELHIGCGQSGGRVFYWCQRASVFENATRGTRDMGDGAYLFDPQGDLRASMIYPCTVGCDDPLHGSARLTVHPSAPEYVQVQNGGPSPIDLGGDLVKLSLSSNPALFTRSYDFTGDSTLAPGETLRLWLQGPAAASSRLNRYWGLPDHVLPDRRGRASLRTYTDVVSACDAWGSLSC